MTDCPNCGSDRIRRGGRSTWLVYLVLIAAGLVAVLAFRLNAALVGGIMVVLIVLAHLVLAERVCLDCGNQWRSG